MATRRQLAAIMFTDITGYSAMMGADEDYARRIRNRHRKVFRDTHEARGVKILQYYGDGTLSIFNSAAAAVECAVDMQIELRKDPEVPLRVGIHTGDISYDDEGAYGDGLNIAARIERLCVPGGVYISAKVYDDIKNHSWLTAISLGDFKLRNIYREIEIYAVTCKGVAYPTKEELTAHPEYMAQAAGFAPAAAPVRKEAEEQQFPVGRKRKGVAALLALIFGFFGIHRFYLGQRKLGMVHLTLAILSIIITVNGDPEFPPAAIFGIIGFIDFVLLTVMPRDDFNAKYNSGKVTNVPFRKARRSRKRRVAEPQRPMVAEEENPALLRGIEYYKDEEFHEAMREFHKALDKDPSSSAAYFNLACCSAILDDPDSAYHYLSRAVAYGFNDFERIRTHEALSVLRQRDDFESFVANGYQRVAQLPLPQKEDILQELNTFNPETLDRLELLGDQLEKGELSREQFEEEKRKLLGS